MKYNKIIEVTGGRLDETRFFRGSNAYKGNICKYNGHS